MSQRAHRIIKIVYAETTLFKLGSNLGNAIINHDDTNDFRNQDGGGNIEIPFRGLKQILGNSQALKLSSEEIDELISEIMVLESEDKDLDDYICYDIY